MNIKITGKVLAVKKYTKKDKTTFNKVHVYDGEDLHKLSLPDDMVQPVTIEVGKEKTFSVDMNLEKKSMYFKDML